MGYWEKSFADGTTIRGADLEVEKGLASWSKSRMDGMIGVKLEHDNHLIQIIGIGDFWQSDTYETSILSSKTQLVNRRIQKKVNIHDLQFFTRKDPNKLQVSFATNLVGGKYNQVNMLWFSKWFTLEYSLQTQSFRYFISPVKS